MACQRQVVPISIRSFASSPTLLSRKLKFPLWLFSRRDGGDTSPKLQSVTFSQDLAWLPEEYFPILRRTIFTDCRCMVSSSTGHAHPSLILPLWSQTFSHLASRTRFQQSKDSAWSKPSNNFVGVVGVSPEYQAKQSSLARLEYDFSDHLDFFFGLLDRKLPHLWQSPSHLLWINKSRSKLQ